MNADSILMDSVYVHTDDQRSYVFEESFSRLLGFKPKAADVDYSTLQEAYAKIVEAAMREDRPYITIFTDSAYPRLDAPFIIEQSLQDIEPGTNAILWGHTECDSDVKAKGLFSRPTGACKGAFAVTVMKTAYDKWLETYKEHPDLDVDGYWEKLGDTILMTSPLFIEFNPPWLISESLEANRRRGYVLSGVHLSPPPMFLTVESVIGYSHYIDILKIFSGNLKKAAKSRKCLIIGANFEMFRFRLRDYVNSFDGDVIRVNRLPEERFKEVYGDRTDILITWIENYPVINSVPHDAEYRVVTLLRSSIRAIASLFLFKDGHNNGYSIGIWPHCTTGFLSALLAASVYDSVELFGFVDPNILDDARYMASEGYSEISAISHDIFFEHTVLKSMADDKKANIKLLESRLSLERGEDGQTCVYPG